MRRFRWLVLVAVVLLIAAAGYFARARRSVTAPVVSPAPESAAGGTPAAAPVDALPRGEVTVDPRRQQLIGVRTVAAERRSLAERIRTVGIVKYDETRMTDLNVKVEGWIRDLFVDSTGQPVRRGQPLFTLYSPELLTTENEYLLALTTRDQMQQSVIADARERADALVTSARQRLALWDLPEEDIRRIETTRRAEAAVTFRAPSAGFVIEKQAIAGLHVMPGQSLYKVADLSTVWVEADLYENEIRDVRAGARATVTIDAYPARRFAGRVIYVYPYLDEASRTNKVRLAFPNRDGRLKPGMYANVELAVAGGMGITVPTDAVLDSGTDQIVFVAHGDGMFEPRKVTVGRRLEGAIQIADGVMEGEMVATGATFFLDSESQLRASLRQYEKTPPADGARDGAAVDRLEIALRSNPDPPKTGENQFEVTVRDSGGRPVDGAEVTVQLFMAAMPTMNMPAMRNEAKLQPAGGGVYRGRGEVLMAGRWEVTIEVTKDGRRVGSKRQPLVTR